MHCSPYMHTAKSKGPTSGGTNQCFYCWVIGCLFKDVLNSVWPREYSAPIAGLWTVELYGEGGGTDAEVELRTRGVFSCYTTASISKNVCAKIALFDRRGVDKMESRAMPSRMSENGLFAK